MRVNKFESAIVMGTMASVDLPSHSQDTRVLQTMLLLRKTHSELYPETPLHVVTEAAWRSQRRSLVPNTLSYRKCPRRHKNLAKALEYRSDTTNSTH